MDIEVRPATVFDDVKVLLGPKRPDASVCWCLSHRLPSKVNSALHGPERGAFVAEMCASDLPPGVVAYDDGEPVGWAGVAPRAHTQFARSTRIPHVEGPEPWSIWCLRVRPGHRGRGILPPLLDGAVAFAIERGAAAIEGYPVDNGDRKVDLTMAFVGFRSLFERAGFRKVADTDSVSGGIPRVLMRLEVAGSRSTAAEGGR
ncbi:hypothetical protein GCM10017576_18780 [Microbacterium barkeri]|uniref:N-acetyltransferase domain-containing protein n=1 Tax=Microbacterium barkeri TaxID=33917 RepID=A0A9W6H464_9MICO|nr:GNAT family N-acetyltransferase [Microbacterium barkeri]MDR6877923.1 GNAT superfamily N-acetyltransferase [Microbacterium barkeri]GLJ61748.1 hypothetical protein GCM10017576_18780 [Microbacterium barkeri]